MAYAKLRPRRGTSTQWSEANTLLNEGEIGIEVPDAGVGTGEIKIKIGDGFTRWNELPYAINLDELLLVLPTLEEVGLLRETLGYTLKNKLPSIFSTSQSMSGVSITVNADKSFTINGTSTGASVRNVVSAKKMDKDTEYIFSGCPKGGSLDTYYLAMNYKDEDGNVVTVYDTGEGVRFKNGTSHTINAQFTIKMGVKYDNLTFYPMLRRADIEDDTYEPCIDVYDITSRLSDLESGANDSTWLNLIATGTYDNHAVSNRPVRYRKKSGVLYINGEIDYISSAFVQVATLPEGYRPTVNVNFPTIGYDADLAKAIPVDVSITTGGVVKVNTRGTETYAQNIYINIAYPI